MSTFFRRNPQGMRESEAPKMTWGFYFTFHDGTGRGFGSTSLEEACARWDKAMATIDLDTLKSISHNFYEAGKTLTRKGNEDRTV